MSFVSEKSIERYLNTNNKFVINIIFRFFKIDKFNSLYNECKIHDGVYFVDALFRKLNIKLKVVYLQEEENFKKNQFTIVSNHPFGILDGFILLKLFATNESECKIVGHSFIKNAKPISKFILPVMPYKNKEVHKYMVKDGKRLLSHILLSKPLIIFPSGKVSTFDWRTKSITDQEWNDTAIKFLLKSRKDITPVYIEGHNSIGYMLLNSISVNLGMIWLIREFFSKRDSTIVIKVGKDIKLNNKNLVEAKNDLRNAVYNLSLF